MTPAILFGIYVVLGMLTLGFVSYHEDLTKVDGLIFAAAFCIIFWPFIAPMLIGEFLRHRAQAGEARRAETTGSVHEHAVPEGDAPK